MPGGDRAGARHLADAESKDSAAGMVLGASVADEALCVRPSRKDSQERCPACRAERPGKAKEEDEKKTWSESDSEGDCALCAAALYAGLWFGKGRPTRIIFNNIIEIFEVVPYSEVYGSHPSVFDFDAVGRKIPRVHNRREHI